MRKLGIDYGDSRVGIAITDPLGITAQGLETIHHKGNDKFVLKRLEEIMQDYVDRFKAIKSSNHLSRRLRVNFDNSSCFLAFSFTEQT